MEIQSVKEYYELSPRQQHQVDAFLFMELVYDRLLMHGTAEDVGYTTEELREHIRDRREDLAADMQMEMPLLYDYGAMIPTTMKLVHQCLSEGVETIDGKSINLDDFIELLDIPYPGRRESGGTPSR